MVTLFDVLYHRCGLLFLNIVRAVLDHATTHVLRNELPPFEDWHIRGWASSTPDQTQRRGNPIARLEPLSPALVVVLEHVSIVREHCVN